MKLLIRLSISSLISLFTTYIKGTTKKIEKEIFNGKEELRIFKNKYELILLEHNYLTSPEKLFEYQKKYFDDELTMIEIENISSIKFEKKKLVINKFIQKKIHENREQ